MDGGLVQLTGVLVDEDAPLCVATEQDLAGGLENGITQLRVEKGPGNNEKGGDNNGPLPPQHDGQIFLERALTGWAGFARPSLMGLHMSILASKYCEHTTLFTIMQRKCLNVNVVEFTMLFLTNMFRTRLCTEQTSSKFALSIRLIRGHTSCDDTKRARLRAGSGNRRKAGPPFQL